MNGPGGGGPSMYPSAANPFGTPEFRPPSAAPGGLRGGPAGSLRPGQGRLDTPNRGSGRQSAGGVSPNDSPAAAEKLVARTYRFPWISEAWHPRHYYHRFQLESVTQQLSSQYDFYDQVRGKVMEPLRRVAKKMRLPFRTVYESELLFDRYKAHYPIKSWDQTKLPKDIGHTAFLLASKTEETMKKARELILDEEKLTGTIVQTESSQAFQSRVDEKKRDYLIYEQEMLEVTGFEFRSLQPQKFIVKQAKLLADTGRLSQENAKKLAKRAWLAVPEINKCSDLNVRYPPHRIAMAALLLATRTDCITDNALALPQTGEFIDIPHNEEKSKPGKHWLDYLPNAGFTVPGKENQRVPYGRALVFEAAIDAADALADFYLRDLKDGSKAQAVQKVAEDLRAQAWAKPEHHPFKSMWPDWEQRRREREVKERRPAAEMDWS